MHCIYRMPAILYICHCSRKCSCVRCTALDQIPALPCPALPCPALPCPAFCMSGTIHVLHWHFPGLKICAQRLDTLTFKAWSAVFWTWSRVGGNGHAPPLHPSRALRPCQNTQSTQQISLMAVTMWFGADMIVCSRLSVKYGPAS